MLNDANFLRLALKRGVRSNAMKTIYADSSLESGLTRRSRVSEKFPHAVLKYRPASGLPRFK